MFSTEGQEAHKSSARADDKKIDFHSKSAARELALLSFPSQFSDSDA